MYNPPPCDPLYNEFSRIAKKLRRYTALPARLNVVLSSYFLKSKLNSYWVKRFPQSTGPFMGVCMFFVFLPGFFPKIQEQSLLMPVACLLPAGVRGSDVMTPKVTSLMHPGYMIHVIS